MKKSVIGFSLLIIMIFSLICTGNLSYKYLNLVDVNNPKKEEVGMSDTILNFEDIKIFNKVASSSQSIIINTPEDKNYLQPMAGLYPATYGFENDVVGSEGMDIGFLDEYYKSLALATLYIGIVDEYMGHKDLMHVYDQSTGIVSGAHQFTSPPVAGTIEFYQLAQGTTGAQSFSLRAMDETTAMQMHMVYNFGVGYYQYYNGSSYQNVANLNVDTWYHHSITFDCEAGVNGIGTWIISTESGTEVGRVENIEFDNDLNVIDKFFFTTHFSSAYLQMLYDAFGFSWDPGYTNGDNLEEGLLLDYYNSISLEWTEYSLDGGTNITIRTITTIPMPAQGRHTIQIFGNDTSGNNYHSELKYFSVRQVINFFTPEDKNYLQPMAGFYPATYGFENELHDTTGTALAFLDEYYVSGVWVEIGVQDAPIYGHNKVLHLTDTNSGSYTYGVHYFDNPQTAGTIEFYNLVSNTAMPSGTHYFFLRAMDDTIAVQMRINVVGTSLSNIEYFDGVSWQLIANQWRFGWYHHSISFDCEAGVNGQFTWIVTQENGIVAGNVENIEFQNNLETLDELCLESDVPTFFGDTKWDAFGFSWDPNYNIGDNLKEGLLLNFTTYEPLDWMAYSLDGGTNITILGNHTIPMPAPGSYTIQVFGNDTLGNNYHSELRNFTVQFIDLVTPEEKIYDQPMSGYYPATYGFENEVVGNLGTAIEFLDWFYRPSATSLLRIDIVDEYLGHKNLIHVVDLSSSIVSGAHWFNTPPVAGTIEFYQLAQGTTGDQSFSLRAMNETTAMQMHMVVTSGVGYFQYHNGSSWQNIGDLKVDIWYHHSITFDCETGVNGTATWIISHENGTEVGRVENIEFDNSLNAIDKFYWTSHFASNQLNMFYDAFGFSWDPGYTTGDNLVEGLLLNYNIPISFNWTGYSLDGGANITIRTNTTIPMPTHGDHTIQIFGNDSLNNYCQSVVRSFQIFSPDPPTISGPNDFSFNFGEKGYSIIWSTSDPDPSNYTVYQNGTIFKEGNWTTSVIASIEGIEQGIHNFTCIIESIHGLTATDEVWVTVLPAAPDTIPPIITSPEDISIEEGSIGYSIIWSGSDNLEPWWGSVWMDTTLIYSQAWIGNDIIITLDGLSAGNYLFNCTLSDEAGNSVFDIVQVTVDPFVFDTSPPIIIPPASVIIEEGSVGNELTWICHDDHPYAYKVLLNNTDILYNPWHGENVTISIDGLQIAQYSLTLVLYDISGNNVSSSVLVEVIPSLPDLTPPTMNTPAPFTVAQYMGGTIIWEVFDEHPGQCIILKNGTEIYNQEWNSGLVQFTFSYLPEGNWVFTLQLWDEAHNFAESSVIITVVAGTSYDGIIPEISHYPDVTYIYGSKNNTVEFFLFDTHAAGYNIHIDTIKFMTSVWTTSNIHVIIIIDGLEVGLHILVLEAWDSFGNTASESIQITVSGDITPPDISSPADIKVTEGVSTIQILWTADETFPSYYKIINLDTKGVIQEENWTGDDIKLPLVEMRSGKYRFRCYVYDVSGNYAFDDVVVTIEPSKSTPGFEFGSLFLCLIGGIKFRRNMKKKRRSNK